MRLDVLKSPRSKAALGRAGRTAIVAFAGLSIGLWGLQNPNIAVFATFSAFALLGIADFGGPTTARVLAYLGAAAGGIVFAIIGTWASTLPLALDGLVTLVVGAAIVMLGLLGGYSAAAASALPLFYLVAVGTPATAVAIPGRVAGVVFGGVMSVLAATLLWPSPVQPSLVPVLGKRILKLGGVLEQLADNQALSPATALMPSGDIRAFIDMLGARPASPSTTDRATVYVINDLDWLWRLTNHLHENELSGEDKEVLQGAARQLSQVGTMLESGGTGKEPFEQAVPTDRALPFSLPNRVALQTQRLTEHARAIKGGWVRQKLQGLDVDSSVSGLVAVGVDRIKSNLTWHSVYFQDAARTGVALAAAIVIARFLHLPHAFWVALATNTVIQRNITDTGRRVAGAVGGTLAGFAVSFVVITLIGGNTVGYALLTPLLIALAIFATGSLPFWAGQAAFTATIIVLFNLLAPTGWPVGIQRVEDVVVGCLVGLMVGSVAWPHGAISSLRLTMADLVGSATEYLIQALETFLPNRPIEPTVSKTQVATDAAKAEDAFALYLREKPPSGEVERWSQLLAASNRLWYAGSLVSTYHFADTDGINQQELESLLWRLEHNNGQIAQEIKAGKPVRLEFTYANDPSSMIGWLRALATEFK
jgi:uncharacterized membrane protein YccC